MDWWRQYQEVGEKALNFARQHPKEGRDLFEAMTMSESLPDKRFIVRLLADYMQIKGQADDGAENFAVLLLDQSEAHESASFALIDAVDEGRLTAADVAHIALATADFARWEISRLESSRTPPQ